MEVILCKLPTLDIRKPVYQRAGTNRESGVTVFFFLIWK